MGANRKKKLQCSICKKVFFSLQTLERHKSYHVNRRRGFKCGKCNNFFMSDTYLKKHHCRNVSQSRDQSNARDEENLTSEQASKSDTRTIHSQQIFKCGFCQSCFVSQKVLNMHMAMTPAKRQHNCTECRKRFHCAQQFHEHFLTHSSLLRVCYVCGEVLEVDEPGFKRHLSSHAEVEELACDHCLKEFVTESELEEHEKECIPDDKSISVNQPGLDTEGENTDMNDSVTSAKGNGSVFTDQDVLRHVHLDFSASPGSKQGKKVVIKKEAVNADESPVPTRRSSRTSRPTAKKMTYEKSVKEENELLCRDKKSPNRHMSEHAGGGTNECKICNKKFKRRRYLKDHIKVHEEQEPHSCHICGLKIKYNPSNFRRHMKKHSDSREFCCSVCTMCFYRADDLRVHMKTHYRPSKCVCIKCGISFSSPDKLDKHMLSHDVSKDIACDLCDKTFVSKTQHQDHCGHEHGGQFPCKLCGKLMNSKYWLEKHKLEFHLSEMTSSSLTNNDEDESCTSGDVQHVTENQSKHTDLQQALITLPDVTDINDIEESFQNANENEASERAHNKSDEEANTSNANPDTDIKPKLEPLATAEESGDRFKCEFCGKSFAKSGNLKRHMNENCEKTGFSKVTLTIDKSKDGRKKDRKPPSKDHQCTKCSKRFSRRCDLLLHERVHAGIKNYVCDVCSSSYFSLSNLNRHKEIHEGRSNNVCHICGKSFACRNYLFTHIKRIHETDSSKADRFQCETCTASFTSYSNFKRHQRIHTGERPHKCKTCSKSFRRTDDLAMHMKTHSPIKPHVCEKCNKSFNQRHNLKKHLKRHDQVSKQIYRCPECKKVFRQKKAFHRHITSHDNVGEYAAQTLQFMYIESTVNDSDIQGTETADQIQHSRTADAIAAAISSIQRQEQSQQTSEDTAQADVSSGQDDKQVIIVLPSDTVGPFQCNLCSTDFPEISQLVSHMVEHE